jgi:hypothetical protein
MIQKGLINNKSETNIDAIELLFNFIEHNKKVKLILKDINK